MKTLGKRLERLERSFAVRIGDSDDWGGLAKVRDEMLRLAKRLGEPGYSEFRTKLDALGPTGLWCQGVRGLLAEHGIVQAGDESLSPRRRNRSSGPTKAILAGEPKVAGLIISHPKVRPKGTVLRFLRSVKSRGKKSTRNSANHGSATWTIIPTWDPRINRLVTPIHAIA